MGEVEFSATEDLISVHARIFLYGAAAGHELAVRVARDIEDAWNEPGATVWHGNQYKRVQFCIEGYYLEDPDPRVVYENTDPRNNYFRVETFSESHISFVDDIGCNTGYFKLDNLQNDAKTAAHEFGHTLGLMHPEVLDIRGKGIPGIMYPRGTLVDPAFQYDPNAMPLAPGGTMNPACRRVLLSDIADLNLHTLEPDDNGKAILGQFSSLWHAAHQPDKPPVPKDDKGST